MAFHLRVMTQSDIPAGMRLKEIAGWNQTARDWERFLRRVRKAVSWRRPRGRWSEPLRRLLYEHRFAWIGMVLVDPASRGQGMGTKLLVKAIEHLDTCGIPSIKLDATPQGKPLYEKLGFVQRIRN